jgi:hypothetical protein
VAGLVEVVHLDPVLMLELTQPQILAVVEVAVVVQVKVLEMLLLVMAVQVL